MSLLHQYLDEIVDYLSQYGYFLRDWLQPGIHPKQVLSQLNILPFKVSQEIIQIYSWRNGTRIDPFGNIELFPMFIFSSLEHVIHHLMEDQVIEIIFNSYDFYFFPIFGDSFGDSFGIKGNHERTHASPIIKIDDDGYGPNVLFGSLTQMMETLVSCYREGAFFVKDGSLSADYDRYGEIALRLNPEIEYWHKYVKGEI
ncbi:MAG: hypothetical protein HQM11_20405 [SAR324 cluster bacterium]|nr:hypothetical protein [SAR324 cluster bacterium]